MFWYFVENDLNREIDRLVEVSTLQKRKISELEYATVTGQTDIKQREEAAQPDERGDAMNRCSHWKNGKTHPCCRYSSALTKSSCDQCDDDEVIYNKVWGVYPI